MRKRMISPSIWEDPSFNKLTVGARLLFIGMFSCADDEGFLRADSGSLRRSIFGFDENIRDSLNSWIEEIKQSMRNVHFYISNEETYAHFTKWREIQKQQESRIIATSYPMCSICLASDQQSFTEVKRSKEKLSKEKEREGKGGENHFSANAERFSKLKNFADEKLKGGLHD